MNIRFAFAGFRHSHVFGLLAGVEAGDETALVAACEEDASARASLASEGKVNITHDNFERMIEEMDCDVVAIGDYYGRRGQLAIAALTAGKSVISDKPLCTRMEELDTIVELARGKGLSVGCQLDMRDAGNFIRMKEIIAAGEIGDVYTVAVTGQHPLLYGTRPAWYFQPGCHGGTINDIAIHAADFIPWITGHEVSEVTAARVWNAKAVEAAHFKDCGQFMLRLDNGGGVIGDVSYLAPDGCGYATPTYWRVTCHGLGGMVETACGSEEVLVATDADKAPRRAAAARDRAGSYLADFVDELSGRSPREGALTTEAVLKATRLALQMQQVADES